MSSWRRRSPALIRASSRARMSATKLRRVPWMAVLNGAEIRCGMGTNADGLSLSHGPVGGHRRSLAASTLTRRDHRKHRALPEGPHGNLGGRDVKALCILPRRRGGVVQNAGAGNGGGLAEILA